MKFVLFAGLLLASGSIPARAQSCVTQEDVRQMLARVESSPATPNKKLKEELLKMASKQRELLQQVVEKDQAKRSDQEKLHKVYEDHTVKLCQIMKTYGWPTTAVVDEEGVFAAFYILKNGATYELQRDLLPVIVAAIKKDPIQKREFAGLYDRLRVSAGLKQLFGTQAVSMGGFLVLYPIEDQANVDARRAEFGLPQLDLYVKSLERSYGKPLIKARQPPTSQLSKQLTDSLTKAIDATQLDANEIDPGDVIKVETSLVNLNVSVFNNKLKMFVGSLTSKDFLVLENNQEQTVTYFASTDVPFDLVLLVDLSGSTAEKRDLIKKSTLRFVEAARPNDRLAIVTFSDTTNVISPLTLDRVQLTAAVKNMEGMGGSHVWDAVKFALDNVIGPKSLERRRAVVLMSDGVDGALYRRGPLFGSKTMFADLIEQVRQTDALIVPIYLDTEENYGNHFAQEEYENARRTLKLLADESGGSYYHARKLSDLNGVYEQVINDLGKVYSLGYKSTNATRDSSWRWVQVSVVNRTDLTARTRPGYYAQ
ncbi:MAG TPA: VWA domain-containing protein [Pyrinomonadaceae bacterium]|jgi:VWFA-related protein|nr:VWA domain-containing protein [Pyrinomonadaceae bacterium]